MINLWNEYDRRIYDTDEVHCQVLDADGRVLGEGPILLSAESIAESPCTTSAHSPKYLLVSGYNLEEITMKFECPADIDVSQIRFMPGIQISFGGVNLSPNMIKFEHVDKVYGSGVKALNDINLEIEQGEFVAVIGLSGAGKSTLVRCINMLERPTAGQVFVDGAELTKMSDAQLRKARQNIGMIFQHFNLLTSRTVFDNIAFPLEIQGMSKAEIEKRVRPLLELVGLESRGDYYPSQLSGGQKQRVGIARALASNPKVLLCDEATSALDPQTTKSILELLMDINKKMNLTIVLITHQMEVVKTICDRVAVIENGVIIEQGDMVDVFINPKTDTTREFTKSVINVELPAIIKPEKLSPTYVPRM